VFPFFPRVRFEPSGSSECLSFAVDEGGGWWM
jgi:hypothetical protein